MARLGLNINKIKAIFISHEHTDHIRGLAVLAKKFRLPVYITANTYRSCGVEISAEQVFEFKPNQPIAIGELCIMPFPKLHDACDPTSFTVSCGNVVVGVFTDIGFPCSHVVKHFQLCNAAFLEANYDDAMLDQGNYPYHLKRRIKGGNGHLSNAQALQLFHNHRPAFMSHLLLSHLSKNNNCPKLVHELFSKNCGDVNVVVASRYEESAVYEISAGKQAASVIRKAAASSQLALAFA